MIYVNTMDERQVFESLRVWLVRKGFGYRSLFWLTGWLAFFYVPDTGQSNHGTGHVCVGARGGQG